MLEDWLSRGSIPGNIPKSGTTTQVFEASNGALDMRLTITLENPDDLGWHYHCRLFFAGKEEQWAKPSTPGRALQWLKETIAWAQTFT